MRLVQADEDLRAWSPLLPERVMHFQTLGMPLVCSLEHGRVYAPNWALDLWRGWPSGDLDLLADAFSVLHRTKDPTTIAHAVLVAWRFGGHSAMQKVLATERQRLPLW